MYRHVVFVAVLVLSWVSAWAADPAASAVRTDQAPVLDGLLDEGFWQNTFPLNAFHVWSRTEAGRRVDDTLVRLAYDNTWLYFGIECVNPLQKLILAPKTTEHDGPVHQDESIEIFLDPGSAGKVYYHFILSCFNVKAEQRFIEGQRERSTWNQPWRSATHIHEQGWSAEVAIPLYIIPAYGDLGRVSLNLARNSRRPFMDPYGVITHETLENSTWRPVLRSFHEIEAFGALAPLEVEPGRLGLPFLASLESVDIDPYFTEAGKTFYRVTAEVRGANREKGELELTVTDTPVTGPEVTVRERFLQEGTAVNKLAFAIPAATLAERTVTVALRALLSGELFGQRTIDNPACLKVMDSYLDRNYYTTERQAIAVAQIALPPDSIAGMRVSVRIDGRPVADGTAGAEIRILFPIADLAIGSHPVAIELRSADGSLFFSQAAELIKRTPKPGREYKIDQINRVVLDNGEPFFPFGPVMYGVKPDDEAAFQELADGGFNTFFQWHKYLAPDAAGDYLVTAAKYGLKVVSLLETGWMPVREAELPTAATALTEAEQASLKRMFQVGSPHLRGFLMKSSASTQDRTAIFGEYYAQNVPRLLRVVESLKEGENLLAYNSFDEPCSDQFFHITRFLDDVYRQTHRADGYHPVMLLYSSHIPVGDQYIRPADILCTDPYWVPNHPLEGRDTPNFVSKIVHWNDLRAQKFRQAVWIIPVAWIWSGITRCQRGISGPEQHCQNFLAIIHGARGLFWFRYPMADAGWQNLKESARMIKVIGPMAVQARVDQNLDHVRARGADGAFEPAVFDPAREQYPDVQGRVFRDPEDGGFVLLAANSRYYPVTATFTVGGVTGAVGCVFQNQSLPVRDGSFSEELEPFAVRAYRLGQGLSEPLEVTIASRGPARLPPRQTAYRNNVRPDQKNVFPNPSFEQETIPGKADYYFGDEAIIAPDQPGKFGGKCLRLSHEREAGYAQAYWFCTPRHDEPTAYVWSFWAKAAKDGEKLWVQAGDTNKTFALTTEWARYQLPVAVAPRAENLGFQMRVFRQGTAWLDGMQLEKGYEPTEFEQ